MASEVLDAIKNIGYFMPNNTSALGIEIDSN